MTESRAKIVYRSGKTYTHNTGLSVAFRQWRAQSHCRFLHGYALQVEVTFEADELDGTNWVMDFGGLKDFKNMLTTRYDHKTIVSRDDPYLVRFQSLAAVFICDLLIVDKVGCEAFAEDIFRLAEDCTVKYRPRVKVMSVVVREHESNWAGAYRK